MASGLQCPGCGHVHPSGLPEIARGDATFRCYGCYRTLSVPDGWTGRASPRPPGPEPAPARDEPPGFGRRDARSARLASRRGRGGAPEVPVAGGRDEPTLMVPGRGLDAADWAAGPSAGSSPAPNWPAAAAAGGAAVAAGMAAPGSAGVTGARAAAGTAGAPAVSRGTGAAAAAAPLGWVAPRRSGKALGTPVRALVWAFAFGFGLFVTAVVLRSVGLLGVNTAIDVYAGSGVGRFKILLALLPLWALLSAATAHFSLEALVRRRTPR